MSSLNSIRIAGLVLALTASGAAAQDLRQTLKQLRSDSDEARMTAFYRLLERGRAPAGGLPLQNKDEIVRELIALGQREQAQFLDPSKRFTPEEMRYYSQLFEVVSAVRNPDAFMRAAGGFSLGNLPAINLDNLLSRASAANISNTEMQIALSGLMRLLTDADGLGLQELSAPAAKPARTPTKRRPVRY